MIQTIRVASKLPEDPYGRDLLAEVHRTLGLSGLAAVRTAKVYRIEGVTSAEAARLANSLLADAIDQVWTMNGPVFTDADRVVEVAYLPGVMNPEAASIMKGATDLGLAPVAVDSGWEYAFYGSMRDIDEDRVVKRLLVNPTVQRVVTAPPHTLVIDGVPGTTRRIPLRSLAEPALMALSDEGLHLSLEEMRAIVDYFDELKRDPTDLELECLAQTWSEHCLHKTFKSKVVINGQAKAPMFTRLKEAARQHFDLVVSAFADNSGVMRFYDDWAICGKVETHNSPSAIEPYGGAMTGSGGVFRDILGTGQGAAVIASTDIFCFAPPDLPADQVPPGCLAPDYLLRKVVAGVRDYGNRMGIPTNNGSVHFHPDFRAKPSVIVGAYGLLPEDRAHQGQPLAGDRILALGGRTGRDGIHGATFSSTAMTSATLQVNAPAVQIGNAVEEKRVLDAVLACRDAGLIRALTDCGAGGFSSAIGEMGSGLGVEVDLERAPLKYTGLAPWEVFLSESQERMVLAVAPEHVDAVFALCARYNVEASDLGAFVPTGKLMVLHDGQTVGELDMHFLHEGWPERTLVGSFAPSPGPAGLPHPPADEGAWRDLAKAVLAHPSVASKEPIARLYDHTVQGTAVVGPFSGPGGDGPNDAAVLAPLLGRPYGVVIAHGLNPVLNTFDPYWGGLWAAAEAVSNLVAVGGNPREMCLIDNFIWPVPDEESLGGLDRAVDACVDFMHALGRPFISGKDSLSSTYRYPDGRLLKIPPVLCISAFGRIPDVARTVTADLKQVGSVLALVGQRDPGGLGGSIWLETLGERGERPPRVDLVALPKTLDAVHAAIAAEQLLACHDVSEGGLLVALAEMAFGGDVGVVLDVAPLGDRADVALFNETAGVFVVEVASAEAALDLFEGVPVLLVGHTVPEPVLRVRQGAAPLFEASLAELQAAWSAPLAAVFHGG